jgi:hypothetical protein
MDWPIDRLGYDIAQAWITWLQGLMTILAWTTFGLTLGAAAVALIGSRSRVVRYHRFWCPLSRRDVEIALVEDGVPGLRRPVAVAQCSVFEPPSAISCRRRCLDSIFRRGVKRPAYGPWA